MLTDHVRDLAATAAVFGFFASVWFGWAQEHPPRSWRPVLIAGSVASILAAVAGGLVTWRDWSAGTALDEPTSIRFAIVVGIEFALAGLGAGLLAWRRRSELIPVWIALVVGVHLFPVAVLFGSPWIHVIGALVTASALVAVPVARARSLPVSAVNGLGGGAVLLLGAVVSLAAAL